MRIIKLNIIYLIFIFLLFTALISCKKEDNINLYNPINDRSNAVFNQNIQYGTVTDINGNIYKTVKIGYQEWMAENLRTINYQNGDPAPEVQEIDDWQDLNSGAFCNYENTQDFDSIATFGRLYNWHVINDEREIAPKGWRIPSIEDYISLVKYLGGDSIAGGKIKEIDTVHWSLPNFGATNISGFTALPGGSRTYERDFIRLGYNGSWWCSTDVSQHYAIFMHLSNNNSDLILVSDDKLNGLSIRCIKD